MRVEVASVEPILLFSVTEKFMHVENLQVVQNFYVNALSEHDSPIVIFVPPFYLMIGMVRAVLKRRGKFINLLRNA